MGDERRIGVASDKRQGSIPAGSRLLRQSTCAPCSLLWLPLSCRAGREWVATTRDLAEKRSKSVLGGRARHTDTTLATESLASQLASRALCGVRPSSVTQQIALHLTSGGAPSCRSRVLPAKCRSRRPHPPFRPQHFLHRRPEPYSSYSLRTTRSGRLRNRIRDRDGGARRGAVGDRRTAPGTAPGALL